MLTLRRPVEEDFTSRWHDEAVAARVGLWLGVAFTTCFVTGLISHWVQHPADWFVWPTRPVSLYRITQGLHVVSGIAAVPLFLVKLWTVYPRLFVTPPIRSAVHAAERASILLLVAAVLFQLVTGLQNIAHWYPWGFSFPAAHHAVAWVAAGALLVHIAVKLPATRRGLGAPPDDAAGPAGADGLEGAADAGPVGPSRRWLLVGAGLGVGAAVLATAGQTVPWLRRVSVLAVRSGQGPQGVPVNRTASSAGVAQDARDPQWRLAVRGSVGAMSLSLADLRALPQHTATLPIACVEGWSATAEWAGVRLRDLADAVGVPPTSDVLLTSLQQDGPYRSSVLPARHVRDDLTLLALRLNGEELDLDHGYPCRLIAPSRPGVTQTKWLASVEGAP